MEPLPDSASDAANQVLRRMLERRMCAKGKRPAEFGDFEELLEFTDSSSGFELAINSLLKRLHARFGPREKVWCVRPSVPIRRFHQSVFAEILRQALREGLPVVDAIEIAAKVNPSRTLRKALRFMSSHVRAGETLGASLAASRAWVDPGLLGALEVSDEYGGLADELKAFVKHDHFYSGARFRRAIGRRPEAARFAAALARLLRDHRLSARLVLAAGRVCGGRRRFLRVVKLISDRMENGESLSDSLERHPAYFDAAFCRFVALSESREDMRLRLERLASAGDVG